MQLRPDTVSATSESHSIHPSGAEKTSQQRSIPSLDGLRAVSVSLVILAHYVPEHWKAPFWGSYLFLLGQLGVSMFFVISGFLITFLLCKESSEESTISLKNFYLRRIFRIFPAFYMYLAVAAALTAVGVFSLKAKDFLIAGTYLWNYYMPSSPSILSHTWSLSLEEQFYLFWPACLKLLKPARALPITVALIFLEPILRVLIYLHFPQIRQTGKISAMLHTRIDTIMFGCLIALLWRHNSFKRFVDRYVGSILFLATLLFLFFLDPLLNQYARDAYHPFWLTFDGVALSVILIYLVRNPRTICGRLMNLRTLRYIGVLSYSLYLWQQMFADVWQRWFPLNLLAAFGCANLSFYLVERPFLRLRDRALQRVRSPG